MSSSSDARRAAGQAAEQFNHQRLIAQGWSCLGRNVRTRWAEVDWLGTPPDQRVLVAVEVKARQGLCPVGPHELLRPRQRRRLLRALEGIAQQIGWTADLRLDLVHVELLGPAPVRADHWPDVSSLST